MNISSIIADLEAEKGKIDAVLAALRGIDSEPAVTITKGVSSSPANTLRECKRCGKLKNVCEFPKSPRGNPLNTCRQCKSRAFQRTMAVNKKINIEIPGASQKKACSGCQRHLPIEDFPFNKNCKDGREGVCKECRKKRSAAPSIELPHKCEICHAGFRSADSLAEHNKIRHAD